MDAAAAPRMASARGGMFGPSSKRKGARSRAMPKSATRPMAARAELKTESRNMEIPGAPSGMDVPLALGGAGAGAEMEAMAMGGSWAAAVPAGMAEAEAASDHSDLSSVASADRLSRAEAVDEDDADEAMEEEEGERDDGVPKGPSAADVARSLDQVVQAQQADGSFVATDEQLSAILMIRDVGEVRAILAGVPAAAPWAGGLSKEDVRSVWVTALVVACMATKLAGHRDEIRLLGAKATSYLAGRCNGKKGAAEAVQAAMAKLR